MILQANALKIPLEDRSVHCCVTSPPYWALRDYGTATWEGGDEGCDHVEVMSLKRDCSGGVGSAGRDKGTRGEQPNTSSSKIQYRDNCAKCGAKRIDNQLGLEATPEEYLTNMVQVFREVWRVMRDDGVLWLNMGDSYASGEIGRHGWVDREKTNDKKWQDVKRQSAKLSTGLKQKDLCMMPARLAIALQADGWYLRSMIPWVKRNPMPESCTDRPTTAIEYVFLLTKKANYFYDAEAVRQPHIYPNDTDRPQRTNRADKQNLTKGHLEYSDGVRRLNPSGRNRRNSDWFFDSWQGLVSDDEGDPMALVVNTYSYKEAHFATFGPKLVVPMIKAGTSEKGCCVECGAPWERVVEKSGGTTGKSWHDHSDDLGTGMSQTGKAELERNGGEYQTKTTGWQPTCTHNKAETKPCVVLDIFGGSGTVKDVAERLGRKAIVMDLSYEYCQLAKKRCVSDQMSLL